MMSAILQAVWLSHHMKCLIKLGKHPDWKRTNSKLEALLAKCQDHMQDLCDDNYRKQFMQDLPEIMNEKQRKQEVHSTADAKFRQRMQQSKEAKNRQENILRIGSYEYATQAERAEAYQALANMPRPVQNGDYLMTGIRCSQDASLVAKPSIHLISAETKAVGKYDTSASNDKQFFGPVFQVKTVTKGLVNQSIATYALVPGDIIQASYRWIQITMHEKAMMNIMDPTGAQEIFEKQHTPEKKTGSMLVKTRRDEMHRACVGRKQLVKNRHQMEHQGSQSIRPRKILVRTTVGNR